MVVQLLQFYTEGLAAEQESSFFRLFMGNIYFCDFLHHRRMDQLKVIIGDAFLATGKNCVL